MGNQSASLSRVNSGLSEPRHRVIILVGFMGAGKTVVGRELAAMLGWPFEDLDDRIQSREKRTIEEIFRDSGEAEFRRSEHLAFRELLSEAESGYRVIALGGGAFAVAENVSLLQDRNIPTVFLDAPIGELFRRCQQQEIKRPLRQGETQFRQLYETRRPLYLSATCRVETDGKAVAQIAAEIGRTLGLFHPDNSARFSNREIESDI
ncbi:MAG: shikimate kinase [Terriglobales bacterium]